MTERELILEFLAEEKMPEKQIEGVMKVIDRMFPEIKAIDVPASRIALEKEKMRGLLTIAQSMPFDAVQAEVQEEYAKRITREN